MSESLLCTSLKAQSINPKRYWSRDIYICNDLSNNQINTQRNYKNKVLENKIPTNGNLVNGSVSKKSNYSQLATTGFRRLTRTYAIQGSYQQYTNPNSQNLPFNFNINPGCPHLGYPVQNQF